MVLANTKAGRVATAYFATARRLPSLVTGLRLGYFAWVVLWPQSIPYESLGLLGSFTQSLVDHHHTLLHNRLNPSLCFGVTQSPFARVQVDFQVAWLKLFSGLETVVGKPKRSETPSQWPLGPP